MLLDFFGNQKIPIVLAVAIGLSLLSAKQWADINFVTTAKAEQSMGALSKKVDANGRLLKTHIDKYEINENKKAILLKQDQQFDLKQYVSANGENSMTLERAEDLRRELIDLNDIKLCLQAGRTNCQ